MSNVCKEAPRAACLTQADLEMLQACKAWAWDASPRKVALDIIDKAWDFKMIQERMIEFGYQVDDVQDVRNWYIKLIVDRHLR